MRIEKMGSKADVVVKLVLVFFISLLSFSIGTFVGKKYSDNQHELALLEPSKGPQAENQRDVASVSEETKNSDENVKAAGNTAMSDEEIAKLAEEFVADETEAPAGEKTAEAKTAETKETHQEESDVPAAETKTVQNEHGEKETLTAAHKMAAGEKVEAHAEVKEQVAKETHAVKAERVPSSLPKNVAQYTVGKFTVQVASYASEGDAQKMASSLKQKGYSAFYIPATVKGKTWYRVSVGQFATQKEAQSYKTELLGKTKVGSAIVQKITE